MRYCYWSISTGLLISEAGNLIRRWPEWQSFNLTRKFQNKKLKERKTNYEMACLVGKILDFFPLIHIIYTWALRQNRSMEVKRLITYRTMIVIQVQINTAINFLFTRHFSIKWHRKRNRKKKKALLDSTKLYDRNESNRKKSVLWLFGELKEMAAMNWELLTLSIWIIWWAYKDRKKCQILQKWKNWLRKKLVWKDEKIAEEIDETFFILVKNMYKIKKVW